VLGSSLTYTHSLSIHSNYREVLQQVKETGGRFLEKIDYENNIWSEVSDKAAREKVCQVR
jgi:hypothetical protein